MSAVADTVINSVAIAECMRSARAPAYKLARSVSESAGKSVAEIDYSGLRAAVLPLFVRTSYINLLIKTNWPLDLIEDQRMLDEILSLDVSSDARALSDEVAE